MNTVHTVRIATMEKLLEIAYDQLLDKGNGRYREYFIYRGLVDAFSELKTSLQRNYIDSFELIDV